MSTETLIKEVVGTAELMGAELTMDGARMFCADLSEYPEPMVIDALRRCRREVTGKLTVAAVVSRLDDGRPGPQEAWAMIPKNELDTIVWTDEMALAWGVASELIESDEIAARMSFLEVYQRLVTLARDQHHPVVWRASLGHDKDGREQVISDAVTKGRLTLNQAMKVLPNARFDDGQAALPVGGMKRLKDYLPIQSEREAAAERQAIQDESI